MINRILTTLISCKRLKAVTPISKVEVKLTLEDYEMIKNFQIVNKLLHHNYYKICDFVIEMKKLYPIHTFRILEMYYNLNKNKI
jgi:hypothetical protein